MSVPGQAGKQQGESALLSFQVITDTHVRTDPNHTYNMNLVRALQDLKAQGQGSAGIMHVGDVTDHGLPEEYAEWERIWAEYGDSLPQLYLTMGNHDVGLGNWEERLSQFLRLSGLEGQNITLDNWKERLEEIRAKAASEQGEGHSDIGKGQLGDFLQQVVGMEVSDDISLEHWQERLARFLEKTGTEDIYHDHWINGYHFIFLGTEEGLEIFCSLSEEQLNWLDTKLGEKAEPNRPIFLFLHQPLKDTVAGSYEQQKWYGVVQDAELKAVLARHPQTILFTGHTHWELEAPHNHFDGQGALPTMFNAASVAYLWTDEDEHKDGSQGYYVEVYHDHVLVRGRDFTEGEWIESAQFRVELG